MFPSLARPARPIGIDLGAARLTAVAAGADGRSVEALVELPRIHRAEDIALEIPRLVRVLARRGFRDAPVVVALPDADTLVAELSLPAVADRATLEAIVAAQLGRMKQADPATLACGWWSTDAGPGGSARRSLAAAVPASRAEAIVLAFEEAGLVVEAIDLRPLAVARACRRSFGGGLEIVVDRSAERPTVIVLERGAVTYVRPLAPRTVVAASPGDGAGFSVEAFLAELRLTLGYLVHRHPQEAISRLRLVGSDSDMAILPPAIKQSLDIEAEAIRVDALAEVVGGIGPVGSAPVVAYGLALRGREAA